MSAACVLGNRSYMPENTNTNNKAAFFYFVLIFLTGALLTSLYFQFDGKAQVEPKKEFSICEAGIDPFCIQADKDKFQITQDASCVVVDNEQAICGNFSVRKN
jgi:hypothetical protein